MLQTALCQHHKLRHTSTTYKVRRTSFFKRLTDSMEFPTTQTQSYTYPEQFQAQTETTFLTLLLIANFWFYLQFNIYLL